MPPFERCVFTVRLILAAMLVVLVGASATAVALAGPLVTGANTGDQPLFALLLAGLGLSEIPALLLVRNAMFENARVRLAAIEQDPDRDALIATTYRTLTIIFAAVIEGFGLFGAILAIVTQNPLFLIATALALLLLVMLWPTESGTRQFAERLTRNPVR